MKYLFFLMGFLMILLAFIAATDGAMNKWDASISQLPGAAGMLLVVVSIGVHIYDNWADKQ